MKKETVEEWMQRMKLEEVPKYPRGYSVVLNQESELARKAKLGVIRRMQRNSFVKKETA